MPCQIRGDGHAHRESDKENAGERAEDLWVVVESDADRGEHRTGVACGG
jgi:hypothetical protein